MSNALDRLFLPIVPQHKRKQLVSSAALPPVIDLINLVKKLDDNNPDLYVSDVGIRTNPDYLDITISDAVGFSYFYLCLYLNLENLTVYRYNQYDCAQFGASQSGLQATLIHTVKSNAFKQAFNTRTNNGKAVGDWASPGRGFLSSLNGRMYRALFESLIGRKGFTEVPKFIPEKIHLSYGMKDSITTLAMRLLMGEPYEKVQEEFLKIDPAKLKELSLNYAMYKRLMEEYTTVLDKLRKMFMYDKWLIGLHGIPGLANGASFIHRNLPITVGRIPAGFFLNATEVQPAGAYIDWRGGLLSHMRDNFKLYASADAMSDDAAVHGSVNAALATLRSARNGQYDVYDYAAYRASAGVPGTLGLWENVDAFSYSDGPQSMTWLMVDAV
jgi:hypothetical protein